MVKPFVLFFAAVLTGSIAGGQNLAFDDVIRLPAAINSTGEEGMPLLSPDGKTFFFSRAMYAGNTGGRYSGIDIWQSERVVGNWKPASNNLGDLNNKHNNVLAGFSSDGKSAFLVDASPSERMDGIYTSRRNGNTWARPRLIHIPGIENQDFIGVYVSPGLDVILFSMRAADSHGDEDLYFSIKDVSGLWSKPRNLGATINTAGFEISPFLSADKKRLYFSSNGHGGEGDADIFVSERLYDSWETWTVPVNLGKPVNSPRFDAYFSLYGDTIAYFASNRESKFADLYQVRVTETKTILAKGQRYLTTDEWGKLVGRNVSAAIPFSNKSTTLSSAQQELLFYIVNKLMLERDIRFHLVVRNEEDPELSKQRLSLISDYLKQSGIDPNRIYTNQVEPVARSEKGVIEIALFH